MDRSAGDRDLPPALDPAPLDLPSQDLNRDVARDSGPDTGGQIVKYVFVTAATWQGDLGGVAGADDKCRKAALAAGLPNASSANSYRAWITDSKPNNQPASRFTKAPHFKYTLLDPGQTVVAVGWTGLTTPPLLHPIDATETGGAVTTGSQCNTYREVFTNTSANGTLLDPNRHCLDWTSNNPSPLEGFTGSSGTVGLEWTKHCITGCSSLAHLYCFQQ